MKSADSIGDDFAKETDGLADTVVGGPYSRHVGDVSVEQVYDYLPASSNDDEEEGEFDLLKVVNRPDWDIAYKEIFNKGLAHYTNNRLEDALAFFEEARIVVTTSFETNPVWRKAVPTKEQACIYMTILTLNASKKDPEEVGKELYVMKRSIYKFLADELRDIPEITKTEEWKNLALKFERKQVEYEDFVELITVVRDHVVMEALNATEGIIQPISDNYPIIEHLKRTGLGQYEDNAELRRIVEKIFVEYYYMADFLDKDAVNPIEEVFPKIEILWRAYYFMDRLSSMTFQFYERSHIPNEALKYLDYTREAGEGAVMMRSMLSNVYINDDETNIRQFLRGETQDWLPEHSHCDALEASILIKGVHVDDGVGISLDLMNLAQSKVDDYCENPNGKINSANFTNSLKILAYKHYVEGSRNLGGVSGYLKLLESLFEVAERFDVAREALLIKTLQIRLLTNFLDHFIPTKESGNVDYKKLLGIARKKYVEAKQMRESSGEEQGDKTIDALLNLVEPAILLGEYIHIVPQNLRTAIGIDINLLLNDDGNDDIETEDDDYWQDDLGDFKFIIEKAGKVFEHFEEGVVQGSIKREVGAIQRLEAERLYYLAKALMMEIKKRMISLEGKDSPKKKELVRKLMLKTEELLCEAFKTLSIVESPDKQLERDLYRIYVDSFETHFKFTGVSETETFHAMNQINIGDVIKSFSMQKWADALMQMSNVPDLRLNEDYKQLVVERFREVILQFAPYIKRVALFRVDRETGGVNTCYGNEDFDGAFVEQILHEKRSVGGDCYGRDAYGLKKKYTTCITMNDDHEMMLESSYKLSPYVREAIKEILKGLDALVAIHAARFAEDVEGPFQKDEIMGHETVIIDQIGQRHMPTQRHQIRLAKMIGVFYQWMAENIPKVKVDIDEAKKEARRHDAGKLVTPTRQLLEKSGSLGGGERKVIEDHSEDGLDYLNNRLGGGRKFFINNVIAVSHHQVGGVDCYPYPHKELMRDELRELPKRFKQSMDLKGVENAPDYFTDEELMRVIVLSGLDIGEAMTSFYRAYRAPMDLKSFIGFLKDRAGKDIDPHFAYFFIMAANNGVFNDLIHNNDHVKTLREKLDIYHEDSLNSFNQLIVNFIVTNMEDVRAYLQHGELTPEDYEVVCSSDPSKIFSSEDESQEGRKMKLKYLKYLDEIIGLPMDVDQINESLPKIYKLDEITEFLATRCHAMLEKGITVDIEDLRGKISNLEKEMVVYQSVRRKEKIQARIDVLNERLEYFSNEFSQVEKQMKKAHLEESLHGKGAAYDGQMDAYQRSYDDFKAKIEQGHKLRKNLHVELDKDRGVYKSIQKANERIRRGEKLKEALPKMISGIIKQFLKGKDRGLYMSSDCLDASFRSKLVDLSIEQYPRLGEMKSRDTAGYFAMMREDAREYGFYFNRMKELFEAWASKKGASPLRRLQIFDKPFDLRFDHVATEGSPSVYS